MVDSQDGSVVWHRDKFTGKTMDRPGWQELCAGIEAGSIKTVVVWRLDRLISLRDGLDLSTPERGRLMANVLASVAQYETEIRAERTLAGQEVARARGVRFGRPTGRGKRVRLRPSSELRSRE
jgi:DNA invertase Pin-like site-specific DNA recombinase